MMREVARGGNAPNRGRFGDRFFLKKSVLSKPTQLSLTIFGCELKIATNVFRYLINDPFMIAVLLSLLRSRNLNYESAQLFDGR